MYMEMTPEVSALIITLGIVVPIILLAFIAFIIAFVKRKKKMELSKGIHVELLKKDESGNETDDELLSLFGEDNILSVNCEMSRVTVEVKDIEKVDTDGLQKIGASGVLLVGNKVKCNFKEDAEAIAEYLKGNM